ncbi:hypothetical protein FJW04_20070 [Mesorhizobium sp. B2-7-3]|uniref:hypothetical protein n=1 Tax=Mesorhizobium sp. B2-7-3 TaxID=2589907 RepID=UPI00112EAC42|nr:hypothetical protein [Mesorhizobium sp. B2-7-3]TPJ13879.1 hypothetical protein FJW04_20070 [Mesorhizobium sp. B2-7-3]
MNIVVPLLSIVGPIYFAIRGFPVEFVLVWAAIWTGLRAIATWKPIFAAIKGDCDQPPSWLDRHPSVTLVGVFAATLAMVEATHVAVYYWTIWRLISN